MSPTPILLWQARLLAAALFISGCVGLPYVAVAGALVTLVIWLALRTDYRRRRSRWTAPEDEPAVPVRAELDNLVDHLCLLCAAAGVISLPIGWLTDLDSTTVATPYAAATAVALILGGTFWSSLFDWYWVLPRISGLYGHRFCRIGAEPGGRRSSQEEVTRWWLLHRLASAATVAVGTAGIGGTVTVLVTAVAGLDVTAQAMSAALVALLAGGAQAYRSKVIAAFPLVLHPEAWVGRSYHDRIDGHLFYVDVALEGYKAVTMEAANERVVAHLGRDEPLFLPEKGDVSVALADAKARKTRPGSLYCPATSCHGLSWYCIHNRRAWHKGHEPNPDDDAPEPQSAQPHEPNSNVSV